MEELDLAAELPWVRTSERGSFKKCMQQWQWCYIERLVPVNMLQSTMANAPSSNIL